MKKVILILMLFSISAQALTMSEFLKDCAYGTGAGALVGLASLAFEDKPSEKSNNIARGASLGLYAGIAYGIYEMETQANSSPVVVVPGYTPEEGSSLKVFAQLKF